MLEKMSGEKRDWLLNYVLEMSNCITAVFAASNMEVAYISDNVEQVLGYKKDYLMKDVHNFVNIAQSTKNEGPIPTDFFEKIEMGQTTEPEELEVSNPVTGEIRYFTATTRKDELDGKEFYLVVWVDKTEEVKRNRQMQDIIAVAKSANKAKTSFLANMSHDFRTPMNAITNFNLLIAKNSDNPQKVRDYTHKIGLSCQNLLSLLNDVLDMSKIESGQSQIDNEEFALGLLLEEVNSVIAFQAKGKHQDYQVHSGGMEQDLFVGDKKRIIEVLVNILGNAVKYTPIGGKIDFTITEEKTGTSGLWDVKFVVKDNGIGMSEKFKETIFDPFTRDDKVIAQGIQGTGLGMAISKNLVEMMGGTISVESEEGKGTTFFITLRLQEVEQERGDFWSSHGIQRILVIDSDLTECAKIETALKDTGVEVFFSTSGYKAMHIIDVSDMDQKGFDIILLGMQIRSISCFEMARKIKEKTLHTQPILLLLADEWEDVSEQARDAGIYDFLTKPFFRSTFQQLMEDIVSRNMVEFEKEKKLSVEGMRFLAAEDNEINADILAELMKMENAEVIRAEDGEQAVEMFKESEPGYYDMILMDIQMPVLNGYEAAAAIRKLEREDAAKIPIIAMTANAYADDVQKALDSGMNAHVAKPIDMGVLESTIAKVRENMKST